LDTKIKWNKSLHLYPRHFWIPAVIIRKGTINYLILRIQIENYLKILNGATEGNKIHTRNWKNCIDFSKSKCNEYANTISMIIKNCDDNRLSF